MTTYAELTRDADLFHVGVKAALFNKKGQLLLLRTQSSYAGRVYWDLPGGRVHHHGSIEETLKREVAEETGITDFEVNDLIGSCLLPDRIGIGDVRLSLALLVYKCLLTEEVSPTLSSEHDQYQWTAPRQAVDLLKEKFPPEFLQNLPAVLN